MMKYLETAKIKKHSETIGLHPYIGNRSINMITRPEDNYDREEAICQDLEELHHNRDRDYQPTLRRMRTQRLKKSTT
eukprot:824603-Amphidinium_carterae.1